MIPTSDTDTWKAARLGKVTASRIADLMARTKTGWGASRANYKAELIVERLTKRPAESYTSAAMQWGTDHEAEAISNYIFLTDATVIPGGYIDHPTIAMAGATPDAFAAPDGLIEVKCPNTATHIETLLGQSVPNKYVLQMQWQMACTGRQWCDFISYDPRMPAELQLFVKRVKQNGTMIAEIEKEVGVFLAEIDQQIARLAALYQPSDLMERLTASAALASGVPADWAMGG